VSRKRELRKTKYFTVLSVWMIFLSIGLAIPCVIEGINIARNYYNFNTHNEDIAAGSFIHTNYGIHGGQRIDLDSKSYIAGGTHYDNPAKVIISIMEEDNFTAWINDGSPVPLILNSTYYFNSSDLNVINLKVNSYSIYYIVVYNANAVTIKVDLDITILAWGHIITISILGFLLLMSLTAMTTKFLLAAYFNNEDYVKKKLKKDTIVVGEKKPTKLHEESDERFCVSCGRTLTPKDGQYCPNCGASLGN